ncbi:hypothetical protein IAU60_005953 [Kwoniella sp. DSM 27419]
MAANLDLRADFEKPEQDFIEKIQNDETEDDNLTPLRREIEVVRNLDPAEYARIQRRVLWKIDLRLMPMLFILIILNYLDRNALAAARVQGIEKDLGLKGNNFNVAISVLFVGYILGQIPSNLILARVRPSVYIPAWVAIWGVISGSTAAVHNYGALVGVRFLLGIAEAPYFPGALFLLSSWYTKKELALRMTIMYCGSLLSSAFSGLISAGIQYGMDDLRGLSSWRWLFLIEGAVTVFVAILAMLILPDYPATTRWLNLREKAMAVHRLEVTSGGEEAEETSALQNFKDAIADPKLWLLAVIILTKTSAAAITSFIPTVVNTFGKSKIQTLLLTAPPYVFAAILSLVISISSDRNSERCFHYIGGLALGLVGFVMGATVNGLGPRYASIFLLLGGVYGSYNCSLAWISSTMASPRGKRAAAYAICNTLANFAQIWSPYMYDHKYGPRYTIAFGVNAGMLVISIVLALLLRVILKRANKQMDERDAAAGAGEEATQGKSSFRYVL